MLLGVRIGDNANIIFLNSIIWYYIYQFIPFKLSGNNGSLNYIRANYFRK